MRGGKWLWHAAGVLQLLCQFRRNPQAGSAWYPLGDKSLLRLLLTGLAFAAFAHPAAAQSIEEMAGQMIVVGFQGDGANDASVVALRDELASGRIGGVMFLKTNVASLSAVRQMNEAFRAASPDLVPFLTLDQEGGAVERLTEDVGFTEIPQARRVAADMSPAQAEALYSRMADGIAELGFTVNFGPVVDVDVNPNNQVIARYGRAFSSDPAVVTAYAEAFVAAHRQAGLLTALKHFPGHGSSTADSHEGYVDITQSWSDAELDPYRALFAEGFDEFVMVGHLINANDGGSSELPSSLDPAWLTGVLRDDLGFDGVVISDDLEMGAIRDHYSLRETVRLAVLGGMDVLLFSNTANYRASLGREILEILVSEAASDPVFADCIRQSYGRIVALKARLS